jgi:hypothetical protein
MILLQSLFSVVARIPGTSIVRLKRLPHRTTEPDEIRRMMQQVVDVLESVERARHCLLMDMRDGPTYNPNPEFERILGEYRPRIVAGFAKVAVLVKTSVGKLQVTRMAREHEQDIRVFDDETEALAFLTGRGSAQR